MCTGEGLDGRNSGETSPDPSSLSRAFHFSIEQLLLRFGRDVGLETRLIKCVFLLYNRAMHGLVLDVFLLELVRDSNGKEIWECSRDDDMVAFGN